METSGFFFGFLDNEAKGLSFLSYLGLILKGFNLGIFLSLGLSFLGLAFGTSDSLGDFIVSI